jgi:hydrogenase maturation protease
MTAPVLVIAVGNPGRGDDALGSALLDALRGAGAERPGQVELIADFQLQIEHVVDLEGRRAVLFVDAALPGAVRGASLRPIEPTGLRAAPEWTTHALRPQALLDVYWQVQGHPPPAAWQLAIEGERFELGTALSEKAERHLQQAATLALDWLRAAPTFAAG